MRVAADVPGFELATYQKTVRAMLRHPLVTATYPDDRTLNLVRRWSDTLRVDLAEMFGYRLELHGHTARLVRVHDELDPTRPATLGNGSTQGRNRVLDRQRYAYLSLTMAVLGRAGGQITLGELADRVASGAVSLGATSGAVSIDAASDAVSMGAASDAGRVDGLGFDPNKQADRRAFVDAVTWLEERGALHLADGSAASWASDPSKAEALYDIARDVVTAVYRPTRVLQHVGSVAALLERPAGTSDNARRRVAAQRARRALVEQPVVYFTEVDPATRNHLRSTAIIEDLERLTGLRVERRAEGILLVDTAGLSGRGGSETRFPASGTVTQAALLLLGRMADRIVDPDARRLPRHGAPTPTERQQHLVALVDAGLPLAGVFAQASAYLAADDPIDPAEEPGEPANPSEPEIADPTEPDAEAVELDAEKAELDAETAELGAEYPFIADSFLRTAMKELMVGYGAAFGEKWRADPERLRQAAVELLTTYKLVTPVDGGVLVLPLTGRYRNVDAKFRRRDELPTPRRRKS